VPDWDQEQTGLVSVRDISATGEGRSPKPSLGLAARQHRNRAAVLRPAGDVVAGRDRPLLAIADKERPVGTCNDISCWSQNRRAVTVLTGGLS